MAVRPGPASAGCRMRVSFESRYGTCPTGSAASPEAFASLCTHRRSVNRLWLMFEPSFLSCTSFLVRAALGSARSEPARSTTYRVELRGGPDRACPGLGVELTEMRSTAWLREDVAFIAVRPTLRFNVPSSTKSMICALSVTIRSSRPITCVRPLGPFTSLMCELCVTLVLTPMRSLLKVLLNAPRSSGASGASKSRISSL
mmetsp:Transcript_5782/g.24503  ORF Transcript_5782/g.24503 Transcript_5782/m.24503 type:complete len:201 (+) Transcript_5782:195-797(+)